MPGPDHVVITLLKEMLLIRQTSTMSWKLVPRRRGATIPRINNDLLQMKMQTTRRQAISADTFSDNFLYLAGRADPAQLRFGSDERERDVGDLPPPPPAPCDEVRGPSVLGG